MTFLLDAKTPCAGKVVALRGYDGKLLWKVDVYSEIFAINCHGIDVNKDGTYDCLASGRLGTLVAINPKNGNRPTPEFNIHSILPCCLDYLFEFYLVVIFVVTVVIRGIALDDG